MGLFVNRPKFYFQSSNRRLFSNPIFSSQNLLLPTPDAFSLPPADAFSIPPADAFSIPPADAFSRTLFASCRRHQQVVATRHQVSRRHQQAVATNQGEGTGSRRHLFPIVSTSLRHLFLCYSVTSLQDIFKFQMGKKRKPSKGDVSTGNPVFHNVTLREEKLGKKEVNVSAMLKMEHLQNLATWASGEGSVPCLAALFGRSLAANAEAVGVPLDRSLFTCLKCETILQPGDNCTVRIEKYMKKARRHSKKSRVPLQNNVVYTCHFCSYRNFMVGTVKGHIRELLSSRAKASNSQCLDSIETQSCSLQVVKAEKRYNDREGNGELSIDQKIVLEAPDYIPVTPLGVLPEKKQKMDQCGSSKPSNNRSTKRRRKGWTSLKEIVESNERANKSSISNFVIPFKL